MNIDVSRIHYPVTTLGPGRRVGLWVQGCSIRCPGCISSDTWSFGRGSISIHDLLDNLASWLHEADGLTITGGEPFDQKEALFELLRQVRGRFDTNVLVYSGYPWELIKPWLGESLGHIDALISDPFDKAAPRTLALRGSDNQRLHLLTPAGAKAFGQYERPVQTEEKCLDLMVDNTGVAWMAGIPRNDDLVRLEVSLSSAGHIMRTSRAKERGA